MPLVIRSSRHTGLVIIGVGLDARLGLSWSELRVVAREAERLGFESLWTPAGGVPDAFHLCSSWSTDTSLRTGISVVPAARMWTPWSLAAQAATVAQVSSGRFVLGLGTGGAGPSFWESRRLANRPVAVMREYATTIKALLAGDEVSTDGLLDRLSHASLGLSEPVVAPVYLAALGPQMLRLAGEVADGALLNWATPERIALSRAMIGEGATRAGRDPSDITMTMYIRVCVDDDEGAARRAISEQVLGYALARPGVPLDAAYRGLFAQMGFDEVLRDLEARREGGATLAELVDVAPDDLFDAVGYAGPAAGAAPVFARLSTGLDETIVRVVTARRGIDPVLEAMEALTPEVIRAA